MPRRALVERRPWLLGSLVAAIAYYVLRDGEIGGLYLIGWKGAATAFLAIYALLRHSGTDGRLLAGALAVSAAADMTLELYPGIAVLIFFAAHLFALALFLRNLRPHPTASQKGAAVALLLLTPLIAWLFAAGRSDAWTLAVYALLLGGVAGAGWMSRFSRYHAGAGVVLLLCGKLIEIAGIGVLRDSAVPAMLAWPLYYAGQFMICTGVIRTLRSDHRA